MYRTHTCGELNIGNVDTVVKLSGWVQKSRDLGGMTFVDLRDSTTGAPLGDAFVFVTPEIFADGFESGDVTAWSSSVG